LAHNLKVVGSNPPPATKILNDKNDLRAVRKGGLLRLVWRGSTVEATESNSKPWQQRNAQENSKTSTEAL